MDMRINDIVKIKTFRPVINLEWAKDDIESISLVNSYIITEELAEQFEKILESMTLQRHEIRLEKLGNDIDMERIQRSFIMRGAYGTGKSYFLLVLSSLLECIYNGNYNEIIEKFKDFPNIIYHLNILKRRDMKFLIVRVNGNEEINRDFDDVIQEAVIKRITEEFGEGILNSAYESAVSWLETNRTKGLWSDVEKALNEMDLDYNELVSGLKNRKSEYMKQYENLIFRALGQSININKMKLTDFINETSDLIKDKGYSGIVIIFDELSAFLKASQEDKRISRDLGNVHALAEATEPKRNLAMYFISSMHLDISEFLGVMVDKDEIDKVKRRFSQLSLNFESSNKLIASLIEIDKNKFNSLREDYATLFNTLNMYHKNIYEQFYPLHPATIDYLKSVSEYFAQKESTIFAFLADVVKERKLKEPVIIDNRLNLVNLSDVYDYFIQSVMEKDHSIMRSINSTLNLCDNGFEKSIVKTLVVSRISVFGESQKVSSSLKLDQIKYFLLDETKKTNDFLAKVTDSAKSSIFYDKSEDTYEFIESGVSKIDLDNFIKEVSKTINPNIVFNQLLKDIPGIIIKDKYNVSPRKDVTPVDREFGGQKFTIHHINSIVNKSIGRLDIGFDGTINFVIPGIDEKLTDLQLHQIKSKLKEVKENVCIAIPKSYNVQRESLIEFAALQKVVEDEKIKNDEGLKRHVDRLISKSRRNIERSIKKFGDLSNFKFIFPDSTIEPNDIYELYKYMLDRYYYKFPEINVERINGRTSTNKLIDNFISKGEEQIPTTSNKEEHKQIRETLVPLGLAKLHEYVGGEKVQLSKPNSNDNKKSYEIWNIIIEGGRTTRDLLNILNSPPYGLPDFLVEIYLSCAIALEEIRIFENSSIIQNNSSEIARICSKSCKIQKSGVKISIHKLYRLKNIWKVFGTIFTSNEEKSFDPDKTVKTMELRQHLVRDVKSIVEILEAQRDRFDMLKIKSSQLDNLVEQLNELVNNKDYIIPEKFFEFFVEIPETVFRVEYQKALFELENFLNNLKMFQKQFSEVKEIYNNINVIRTKEDIDYVESIKEKKDNLLKEYHEFLQKPFNYTTIDSIKIKFKELIELYNETFISLHEETKQKVLEAKNDIGQKQVLNLLIELEKIKFKNLQKIDNILKNLRSYRICHEKFQDRNNAKLIKCTCFGSNTNLLIMDNAKNNIDKAKESCERALEGLAVRYVEEMAGLNEEKENKESFPQYLDKKYPQYKESYIKLMGLMNSDYEGNVNEIINILRSLTKYINEYLDMIPEPTKPPINLISYDEFNAIIKEELLQCGRVHLNMQDFIETIKKAWSKIKDQYDEISIS